MRFRRWHRPQPYGDTSRKRAALIRKQRLQREALPLFAEQIAAGQHSVDEEMARRTVWWDHAERHRRNQRAAWWRKSRARLFAFPDELRLRIRQIWRTCPYPADPASFADFLHQIAVGKLDPERPPWIFHQERSARITRNPATFGEAFRLIGRKKVSEGSNSGSAEELLFCGNLGNGILFLTRRVRFIDANESLYFSSGQHLRHDHVGRVGQWIEIEVRGECSEADHALIGHLGQAADSQPVLVRRIKPSGTAHNHTTQQIE